MRKRVSLVLWGLAGLAALGSSAVLLPWVPLAKVQAMVIPLLLASLLLGVGAAAMTASRRQALGLGLVLLALLLPVATLIQPATSHGSEGLAREGRLLTVNTASSVDGPALLEILAEYEPAVVSLPEYDEEGLAYLNELGLKGSYPYQLVEGEGLAGTALVSRHPLEAVAHPELTFGSVAASVPELSLTVYAVHPAPPIAGLDAQWAADLKAVGDWARAQGGTLAVMGDFNSWAAHPQFRELCTGVDGLRGCGSIFAKPTWGPGSLRVLRLDHVLTKNLKRVEEEIFFLPGTDHSGVGLTLR